MTDVTKVDGKMELKSNIFKYELHFSYQHQVPSVNNDTKYLHNPRRTKGLKNFKATIFTSLIVSKRQI